MTHQFQRQDVMTIIKSCNEPNRPNENTNIMTQSEPEAQDENCCQGRIGFNDASATSVEATKETLPPSALEETDRVNYLGEEMPFQKSVYNQSKERLIYDSNFCRKIPESDDSKRVKVLKIMQIGDVQILTRKIKQEERRRSACDQLDNIQKTNASVNCSNKSDASERNTAKSYESTDVLSNVNNPVEKIKTKTTRSASCSSSPYKNQIQNLKKDNNNKAALNVMQTIDSEEWKNSREEKAKSLDLSQDNIRNNIQTEYKTTINGSQKIVSKSSKEALSDAALRLRKVYQDLENGSLSSSCTKNALQYAIDVLETRYLEEDLINDENFVEEDAIVPLQGDNVVPPEIKRWLVQTFSTRQTATNKKKTGEKRTLRGVVHAVQAGMFVERLFLKSSGSSSSAIPADIKRHLQTIDSWSFDVFELEEISAGHALKYTLYELLNKYGLMRKYKIDTKNLMTYCERLEVGYRKHGNRYHNPIHAADVTQAVHCFLIHSGSSDWLTDLEIFAMLFAAAIHDLEHTGTTNNFHTQTRSNLALLYNDRSVLENHHISAAFRIMWSGADCDILRGLNKEEFAEFRALVVEMVLATDMSRHVGQLKQMKSLMQHPENLERSKAMSLMLHSADINHPTRDWDKHKRWTSRLVEEFFKQGDRERELGLPVSPLCDRHSTMLAQSQIGFINYVIKPTYDVLLNTFWKISDAAFTEPGDTQTVSKRSSIDNSTNSALTRRFSSDWRNNAKVSANQLNITKKITELQNICNENIKNNCLKWKEMNEIEQKEKSSPQTSDKTSRDEQSDKASKKT